MDSSLSPSVANDAVSLVDLVRRAQEGERAVEVDVEEQQVVFRDSAG